VSLEQWPPLLADLKIDAGIDADDTRDDAQHAQTLAAAIDFVQRRHRGRYDFGLGELGDELLPAPDIDTALGTVRLAVRWHTRRRSPDALISLGDMGGARVSSYDVDIDRMLRIGRFSPSVIA
jgi:hypothetical protein